MRIQPEIGDASIVLVGNFNPTIFQPEWFGRMGILSEEMVKNAEVEIIHPDIAKFRSDWLEINVERNRFIATTEQAPWVRLSDLVLRVFKENLSHTPLEQLGINRRVHFSVGGEKKQNDIGCLLAPHAPWGDWAEKIENIGNNNIGHGGVRSITMEQTIRDKYNGYIRSSVQPSTKLAYGIYMLVNDHIQSSDEYELIDVLEEYFENSIKNSENIVDQIMKLAKK